jgi:hypothetical protein
MIKYFTRFLIIVFCTLGISATAQKLLTNRQIYNFDVGDAFEYQLAVSLGAFDGVFHHLLYTVLDKRVSKGNDTIFYTMKIRGYYRPDSAHIYAGTDTAILTYTNLDFAGQIPAYVHTKMDSFSWTIDTFNHRPENKYSYISPNPNSIKAEFHRVGNAWVEGLGKVSAYIGDDGSGGTDSELVYYKKGNEVYGTSYFTGIESRGSESTGITMFPNPVRTGETLSITAIGSNYKTLKIMDMTGRILYSYMGNGMDIKITGAALSTGVYTVWLDEGNEIFTQKLVVVQ